MGKLTACGIVAEYNPFHKGHKYHIDESRRLTDDDVVVVCMSGNYTQRGELAIIDKWSRAETAILGGADLVVELPMPFSVCNAGYFAKAGVEILENLGVSHISFGTEECDGEKLKSIAEFLRDNESTIEKEISESVKKGISYPKARAEILEKLYGDDLSDVLDKPNNILALEYIRNMDKAKPVFVERKGAEYNETDDKKGFMSALGIREKLETGERIKGFVPEFTEKIIDRESAYYPDKDKIFNAIVQKVISSDENELNQVFGAEEGLGTKLKREIRKCRNYDDMIELLKSKRYTRTRISRVILNVLLGITKQDVEMSDPYIRVLAFNERGASYIKQVKKDSDTVFADDLNSAIKNSPEIEKALQIEIESTDIYNLLCGRDLYGYSEYVTKPVIIKDGLK